MAFGMLIRSTDGMVNVADMRAARLHAVHTVTAASGSVAVPGFAIAKGFIWQRGGGGTSPVNRIAFNLQWRQGEGRAYWNNHQAGQNLTMFFFLTG